MHIYNTKYLSLYTIVQKTVILCNIIYYLKLLFSIVIYFKIIDSCDGS